MNIRRWLTCAGVALGLAGFLAVGLSVSAQVPPWGPVQDFTGPGGGGRRNPSRKRQRSERPRVGVDGGW